MGYGGYMMDGYGGWFMGLIIIIAVGVLIYFFVIQKKKTDSFSAPPAETPLDILNKRYARGEISKEEYDQMKTDLQKHA